MFCVSLRLIFGTNLTGAIFHADKITTTYRRKLLHFFILLLIGTVFHKLLSFVISYVACILERLLYLLTCCSDLYMLRCTRFTFRVTFLLSSIYIPRYNIYCISYTLCINVRLVPAITSKCRLS